MGLMTDIYRLHGNWYYLLAAGLAVAGIVAAIIFVFACRHCRKAKQHDVEEARCHGAIPLKLFKLSSKPQPSPIQAPAPAINAVALNPTAPPGPPLDWDSNYSFRDCMKTYGEQHRADQWFDRQFLPSLSTCPESRQVTEDLIKERMIARESMGFPYNRTPMVRR